MTDAVDGSGLGKAAARWLPLLYCASGATGLCYEVLWARMLTTQFGLSTFGVAVTVAAFLMGLGLGTVLAQARCQAWPRARALRFYALMELAVGAYALALPVAAAAVASQVDAWAAQLGPWPWRALQGAMALALLALPAAAMGASFPAVLRAATPSPARVARLYAINTLGAAAGALLGLVLMLAVGWSGALRGVAGASVALAAAALLLSRRGAAADDGMPAAAPVPPQAGATAPRERARRGRHALAYAAVGACAIMLEIAWTRLYGIVLLRSEYVLALILAVYLLGTALGSLAAARSRPWLLEAIPLLACGWILLGLGVLAPVSSWMQARHFASLPQALAMQALVLALCTFPATLALGAWLPALARAPGAAPADDARTGARLYGANCLGGAAGALLAVLAVIPWLGAAGAVVLSAVGVLLLGGTLGASRRAWLALAPALVAAWLLRDLPAPERLLGPGTVTGVERYRYEDALTLTQVVEAPDGQRTLLTDLQHLDASSEPAVVPLQANQGRLPLLLHRAPRSVLFLGLGTGISASGSLPYADLARTAVEISPGAIEAARRWFAPVNGGVMGRMRVVQDDARHFLAASPARYDVIVGDLFHPDVAGMGSLLSVEQFARARRALAPGGVFVQWVALNQFDRESLDTVLRGFRAAFPDNGLFLDGAHLALAGSAQPLSEAIGARLLGGAAADSDAASGGEGMACWLGRYWGPIATDEGPLQSEARPVIDFRLPRLRYGPAADEAGAPVVQILRELLRQRPDAAMAARQLGVVPGLQSAFSGAYAASELSLRSWLAVQQGDAAQARQLVRLAYEADPQDHRIAADLADDLWEIAAADGTLEQPQTLERILRIDPDHMDALRATWRQGGPRSAAALARLRQLAPLDNEFAAIGVRSP